MREFISSTVSGSYAIPESEALLRVSLEKVTSAKSRAKEAEMGSEGEKEYVPLKGNPPGADSEEKVQFDALEEKKTQAHGGGGSGESGGVAVP